MPKTRIILTVILLALPLVAQSNTEGDEIVSVPKKYVSSEGLAHQDQSGISKYIGIGREIGVATKEGLSAVVDQTERFGTTKVGTFIMAMVAWKIIGHDLLRVVLGIPIWIAGACVWMWSYRRMHLGFRALKRQDGKVKEWEQVPAYSFHTDDGRSFSGAVHVGLLAAWCITWIVLIF